MDVLNSHSPRHRVISNFIPSALKFIFSGLLIGLAFSATYDSNSIAFSTFDVKNIVALGVTINTVLLLLTLFFVRPQIVVNAILALIVLAGIGTTYIIHTELYFLENRIFLVSLVCAMLYFTLFIAFRVIDDLPWTGITLSLVTLVGLLVVAHGHIPLGTMNCMVRDVLPWGSECGYETEKIEIPETTSFQITPNIYFVGYESMIPKTLLNKHLALETTQFHEVFEENFRTFPNMFSNGGNTRSSFNTLLSLYEDTYLRLREEFDSLSLFSGQHPSPLLRLLQKNGYHTTSIYENRFMGLSKGKHIDDYVIINNHRSVACDLLDESIRLLSFWGYCQIIVSRDSMLSDKKVHQLTIEYMMDASANEKPQFVIVHLNLPGHTDNKSFRYNDATQLEKYISHYLQESNQASIYLEQIITHIESSDPDAILFVFGDHGSQISKGIRYEDAPAFYIQDRFGIIGGVYPPDICPDYFDETVQQGYMTTLDVVHTILRCISSGDGFPTGYTPDSPVDHDFPKNSNLGYKDFLYE